MVHGISGVGEDLGEEMRDDKLQGVLVNTVHTKCIVQ